MPDRGLHPRSGGARRVWIVNHHAGAPDEAAGTRHYGLARQLVKRGHAVTIFAGNFPGSPGKKDRLGPVRLYRVERFDGVRFVWLRTLPYSAGMLVRSLNMLSFMVVFLVVQTSQVRPDLIIGSTVHPFAALGGWIASRLRGSRFAFEVRDLWPQTLVDLGAMREGSPGERGLRMLEAFLVRRASAVITLLPGIRDYLRGRGLPDGHVVYVPNGADLEAFGLELRPQDAPPEVARTLEEIARLRAAGRFVLGYAGAFGRVNRVDLVVQAAVDCEAGNPGAIGLVAIGEGPERPVIEPIAAGIDSVWVGTAIPKAWVPAVLRALDAAVVHTTYTPVYRYGISFNKLFEYMAAERPVVFACDSAYDPVRANGAGITIQPDDPQALASAYLELAGLAPGALATMGRNGREYVEREHSMEGLGETLAAFVEERAPVAG